MAKGSGGKGFARLFWRYMVIDASRFGLLDGFHLVACALPRIRHMRRPLPLWVWLALAVGTIGVAVWAGVMWWLVDSTVPDEIRGMWRDLLADRWPLLLMGLAVASGLMLGVLSWAYSRWFAPLVQLAERIEQVALHQDLSALGDVGRGVPFGLTAAVNRLLAQRGELQSAVEQRVQEGTLRVQAERNQLAALMAELSQSVVVCNSEGRVLLFNQRARLQFKALAGKNASEAAWLGVGRSIYAVLDEALISHALQEVKVRLERGAATPSAVFVTATPTGHLLRVHVGSVSNSQAGVSGGQLDGFVLLVDNITREFEEQAERDALLHQLTELGRASLANMKSAVETLERHDLDPETRVSVRRIIHEEVRVMQTRIQNTSSRASAEFIKRWPLQEMMASDLVLVAKRQLESWVPVTWVIEPGDESIWIKVDSYSLVQALAHLALRVVESFELRHLRLRVSQDEQHALLDLVWTGGVLSTETAMSWELDPMQVGVGLSPLSVRDVVKRHDASMWFERARAKHEAFFRWSLPLHSPRLSEVELAPEAERPEFFDFDLFATSEQGHAMDERPLEALAYTVFDTETTGMNPSGGDEIIQLGAVRIVNGRLKPGEQIDQLIDPQRNIPASTIPVHGITPDMVQGQPTILEVLPNFHAFARGTVLVAHNAAFDMRLLELKQDALGQVFDQPVLDTLLLSAVVNPEQSSHRLDAIAERFGIEVKGRHTAMGDALVTAQVFLKLLPLLQAKGIRTLGEAREASQKTYYARLKY